MKKQKRIKYKDNWELRSDVFEVHWINDKAVAIRLRGATFYDFNEAKNLVVQMAKIKILESLKKDSRKLRSKKPRHLASKEAGKE